MSKRQNSGKGYNPWELMVDQQQDGWIPNQIAPHTETNWAAMDLVYPPEYGQPVEQWNTVNILPQLQQATGNWTGPQQPEPGNN